MKLKYGKEKVQLPIQDENIIKILNLKKQKSLLNPKNRLTNLLKNPINCPSLKGLIIQKKAKKILIIVNDVTRPTPYEVILPPLLDELHQIGIKKENIIFMVATGIHRSNSQEEMKEMFGKNIFSVYKFINHDCDNPRLKDLGKLKSGNKLWVDPIISDTDFIITSRYLREKDH
jgi:nickel-dependent lactate racemase